QAMQLYVRLNRPDLAYALVEGNRAALSRLANLLESNEAAPLSPNALAARCRQEAEAMLAADAARRDAPADTLAELAQAGAAAVIDCGWRESALQCGALASENEAVRSRGRSARRGHRRGLGSRSMLKLSDNPPVRPPGAESMASFAGEWWVAHTKARFEKRF